MIVHFETPIEADLTEVSPDDHETSSSVLKEKLALYPSDRKLLFFGSPSTPEIRIVLWYVIKTIDNLFERRYIN